MFEGIDITSREWCNIVFRGKNQSYGAYYLRRTSPRRHLHAVLILLSAAILFVLVTIPISDQNKKRIESTQEMVTVVEFDLDQPQKELSQKKLPEHINVHTSTMQMVAIEMVNPKDVIDAPKGKIKEGGEDNGFDASLGDSKNSDAGKIYDDVERINRELAASRAAYERGQAEVASMDGRLGKGGGKTGEGTSSGKGGGSGKGSGSSNKGASEDDQGNLRERSEGDVYVSYFLEKRRDTFLYIPAYKCQFGGVVVVNIVVNRSGKVLSASVDHSSSNTSDDCIEKMSIQSALASTFNTSTSAPDKQRGTITYRFAAQ